MVGLAGVAADGAAVDADETAIDGARVVGHRALAQQLAVGPCREVVLQGPDVVHLLATAEVGREDLAVRATSVDGDIGPDPVVGRAEAHGEGAHVGILSAARRRAGRSTMRPRPAPGERRRRATRAPPPRARSPARRARRPPVRRTPRPPPPTTLRRARTQVRGNMAEATASHQCTISTGCSTRTPTGTSTTVMSGPNASLRRTSASPPSRTEPTMSAAPGTSPEAPTARPQPDVFVIDTGQPLCTSTRAAVGPTMAARVSARSCPAGVAPLPRTGSKRSSARLPMGV